METVYGNILYMLWKKTRDRQQWPELLEAWAGIRRDRALELLLGEPPSPEEAARIARKSGVPLKALRREKLLAQEGVDVLLENVRFLVTGLERRQKRVFAQGVGVHPTTVSKWIAGRIRPESPNQAAICRYFGFKAGTDLKNDLLFLSFRPLTISKRKRWLHERIDEMTAEKLGDLFTALEKLLQGSGKL